MQSTMQLKPLYVPWSVALSCMYTLSRWMLGTKSIVLKLEIVLLMKDWVHFCLIRKH